MLCVEERPGVRTTLSVREAASVASTNTHLLNQPLILTHTLDPYAPAAAPADTSFLAGLGVMDYSLLVGVDKARGELVVGVIDYIRQVGGVHVVGAGTEHGRTFEFSAPAHMHATSSVICPPSARPDPAH